MADVTAGAVHTEGWPLAQNDDDGNRRASWASPAAECGGTRVAELERILGTAIQLIEVVTIAELVTALRAPDVVVVALDAPRPGEFTAAVEAAAPLPVLRPLWRRQRNTRGDVDEVFDGYRTAHGRRHRWAR